MGDYLRGSGYNVTADAGDPDQNAGGNSAYCDPLTDEDVALLETFDLIIFHRSTDSSSFDESHPIFNFITIDQGAIEMYTQEQDINAVDTGGNAGNGDLLAETENNLYTMLVVWDTPGAFEDGRPESHTERRIFFPLMRYFEDDGSGAISFEQYSESGLQLIANIVEYAITGDVKGNPPLNVVNWDIY